MQTLGLTGTGSNQDHIRAHKHCMGNRTEVEASSLCGCFYCMATFVPSEIMWWTDEEDKTAECPKCGLDSVIGSASGFPITKAFLQRMHDHWF